MENQIVEEINKANAIMYGPIQPCCNVFLQFCRCKKIN